MLLESDTHDPKMRMACAFDGTEWMYFLSSEADGSWHSFLPLTR